MTGAGRPDVCPGCGATGTEGGRCPACRATLVRGATRWAVSAAFVAAVLLGVVLALAGAFASRFTVVWLALGAAAVFLVFKLCRRVAYDLLADRLDGG